VPQKFTPGQKAKLDHDYLAFGETIATSRIAQDGGLLVASVDVASFLTQFAPAGATLDLYWGLWLDSELSGTDGGDFTSGAWRTRVLNTEMANTIAGASLAGNQVTLPAGTYIAWFSAPAYQVNHHATRLYDVTNATVLARGSTTGSVAMLGSSTDSPGFAIFTLGAPAALEVQHCCETDNAGDGMGTACGFGDTETYAQVTVLKVA